MPAAADAEWLCDPAYQDCRAPLLNLIKAETVGIDVAFWFMQDTRYESAILARWNAGVPVRVLVDPKANPTYTGNAQVIADLAAAGIPIRYRLPTAPGILHWKTMIFAGQNQVEFDGANYSPTAFIYQSPYSDYEDESIYFSDDPSIVNSFKTKYDDLWLDTTYYGNYANITNPPSRIYPIYTKDPALNFPQQEDYALRILKRYAAEKQQIDVIMYRVTDERHTNAMIAAMQRGIPVRIIGDTFEYRNTSRIWVSYNMDRMWAAGIPYRVRAHAGLNHQKLVIMYGQQMAVFGSSNWTTPSANQQQEHNYFATKPWIFQWFVDQFERKWNNLAPNGAQETDWFTPLPPDKPTYLSPAAGAIGVDRSLELKWDGGPWAHVYDIYFGTDPNPPLFAANQELGPTDPATPTLTQRFVLPLLTPGTTYYWKIVSKTMAGVSRSGPIATFTTAGVAPPPQPSTTARTIVLWTATDVDPSSVVGNWQWTNDATAAGGRALWNPDHGQSRVSPPLASPANYFQATFTPTPGVPYHVWLRLKAQGNSTSNNSVSFQFDNSVDLYGSPLYQIGTAQGGETALTDPSGAVSGWGWADNDIGAPATLVYFPTNGPHTIQIQQRSDGAMVDQIVLSPDTFLTTAPGGTLNDHTIYGSTVDGADPPPPPPPSPPLPPPVPAPWQQQDIGAVGMPGYASFDPGTSVFTSEAAGVDVWGNADSFHFVYEPLAGDGSIVARVATLQNTNVWTKAGVMIRESVAAGAANAFMLVSSAKGLSYQGRNGTGASTTAIAGPVKAAPYWVRLDRAGNTFTAYRSADGVAWTSAGSYTIAMAANVLVGLAVSSHNPDATAVATFDSVSINGTAVCGYVVTPASQSIDASGGTGTLSIATGNACTWTAVSGDTSWLTVSGTASGHGNGSVTLSAAANTGGSRSTTLSVGGQSIPVAQSAASCRYTISPAAQSLAVGGDTATVAVTTNSWCSWTAASGDPTWLTVAGPASGTGSGTVTLQAAANGGGPRSATATIGGQTFTASQAGAACTYAISPGSGSLAAGGDTATVTVTTGSWCSWSASTSDPTWLTIAGGGSGTGSGTVTLQAAANGGAARTATATIGDQTFTASQAAAPCTISLSPASQSLAVGGDTATVAVTAGSWCSWTAVSSDPSWLTVTGGASGSGNGTVTLSASANAAGARTATVAIGSQTFAASQAAAACSYAIAPGSQTVAAGGDTATVTVTTGSWCSWTAAPNDQWLTVRSGASGTGSGTVTLGAAANTGPARIGTATIAGQTFSASQPAGPCSYAISPASDALAPGGDVATISVTTGSWCSWSAATASGWLTIASGASGTGSGTVTVTAPANTGAARTDIVTIAGLTFTASQVALPSGWSNQDIGAVGAAGSTTFNSSTASYSLTGAGADIWGTGDAFQYAYQPLSGDGSIVARVAALQTTNGWTKAGVMIRETLDPGSANAFMIVTYNNGLMFQRRQSANGLTVRTTSVAGFVPYFLRLDRAGDTFTAYLSSDGIVWTLAGTDTVPMAASVYVGLAVTGHSTASTAGATFDNVAITAGTPASPTPWMHRDIGSVGAAGTASFNATTGVLAVKGAGADIWGTADAFHYLYRPMTGDGVVVARVTTIQNINSWTKAGVMIRETLDPGSAQALMLASYGKGLAFQRRTAAGGTSASTAGALVAAPYWVKLERLGSTFNAYSSPDGTTWTLVGTDTIPMAATVYVGLAVSSHSTTATAQATFDNVSTP